MASQPEPLDRAEVEALETPTGRLLGAAPITRVTAQANAQAKASAHAVDQEHVSRIVVEDLDAYDSRWSRDPGRANGPYS